MLKVFENIFVLAGVSLMLISGFKVMTGGVWGPNEFFILGFSVLMVGIAIRTPTK